MRIQGAKAARVVVEAEVEVEAAAGVAGVEEDTAITIAVDVAPLAAAVAVRDIAGAAAAGESCTGDENILVGYPAVPSRVSPRISFDERILAEFYLLKS